MAFIILSVSVFAPLPKGVCCSFPPFGALFSVCVWIHSRSLGWICTIVEELCVALREEFRYSLVGQSVGWWLCVPVLMCVSHGVYPLWAARLSARPCMPSWGVVGHCRMNL